LDSRLTAVRLQISCEDVGLAEEIMQDLLQWEDVSEDPAGAHAIDPGTWGFVVSQLVNTCGLLVAYLAYRAQRAQKSIKVQGGKRLSFVLRPDATEEDKAALVQLLAEYGEVNAD